ncbi:MAG TPA: zinc ribbon domain-containing protein, partial [Blastocatellia bacterium]|nr:zinc ribbon domain-containing protein [Blastocatellia bacterium]
VSFTLLYFDSRVRKEAYDLELLARDVAPGFYWQPTVQTPFGYPTPTTFTEGRAYLQTSPLGLAGYGREMARAPSEQNESGGNATGEGGEMPDKSVGLCSKCGAQLEDGASFCMICGTTV